MVQLSFDVERLEHRQLLAGNVTAQIVNGELRIAGDELDNLVVVGDAFETNATNELVVFGLGGTLINGQESVVFQSDLVDDLRVDLGAGNDGLSLAANESWIPNDVLIRMGAGDDLVETDTPSAEGQVRILTGAGADRIDTNGTSFGDLQIQTGAGTDEVHLNSSQVTGTTQIQTGRESDLVTVNDGSEFVGHAEFDLGPGDAPNEGDYLRFHDDFNNPNQFGSDLTIRGGAGPQTVIADFVQPIDFLAGDNSIHVSLGTGNDRMDFNRSYFFGSADVRMGAGEDSVEFEGAQFRSNLFINTGRDSDTIELKDISMRGGTIVTANGNDEVLFHGSLTMNEMRVSTGSGNDFMQIGSLENGIADVQVLSSQGEYAADLGGGNDVIEVAALIQGNIGLNLGSGDDSAQITALIEGQADVNLGRGNDALSLWVVWEGDLLFDGGSGQDEMLVNHAEPDAPDSTIEFINFEIDNT